MPQADTLEAAIVRPGEIRPRLRGDTLNYNTREILLRPNANVEELLGRLPGLQVDENGSIFYNGEKINRLLVDGEDLFAANPTIVTRNFDASKIDHIQLIDRKSDKAHFTGIDDGSRTKTLNLVLKEDSKKGYFGKIDAGADCSGIYNADGLLASFRHREQFAALGLVSNTGNANLSNYSGGSNLSFLFFPENDDPLGASAGKGIPRSLASALHYANTWNGDNDHLVGNYQYSNLFTRPVTITHTVQTLPDSIYTQYKLARSVNRQNQHWGYCSYDWVVNKYSAFRSNFDYRHVLVNNQYRDSGLSTFNNIPVNSTQRTIQSNGSKENMDGDVSWRIQSRKKAGRIFSIGTSFYRNNSITNGFLYSLNRFYRPNGLLQAKDTIDQRKQIIERTRNIGGDISYAEPLWGKNTLGVKYRISYEMNQSLQATYDKDDGKYQYLVDSLSYTYIGHILKQSSSVILQGNGRMVNYALGTGMLFYSYRQKGMPVDNSLDYHYLNFTPSLMINYTPNTSLRFNLYYLGSSQQPSFMQLQPLRNNNDPLHIVLGSPNLKPSYNQSWSIGLTRVKAWMYSVFLNMGISNNNISTRTNIDSLGRQVSQPVNVDGGRNLDIKFSVNKKLLGMNVGLNSSLNYSRTISYINTDINRSDVYTSSVGLTLSKYVENKYSIQLDSRTTYFDNHNSVNTTAPTHYWTQYHTANLNLFFVHGFEINTNVSYCWQQKNITFVKDVSVTVWNASVVRNFLANRLVFRLQVNNLLDQNTGINRSNVGNVNTESSTNILGRYWLLSLTWHFEHKYKPFLIF